MPAAMHRVLISAGANLEAQVEEPFRIVFVISGLLRIGQSAEVTGQSVWQIVDKKLIVINGIRLQVLQDNNPSIVVLDRGPLWFALLVQFVGRCSVTHKEGSWFRGATPDTYRA